MFPLLRIAIWFSLGIALGLHLPSAMSPWWLWGLLLACAGALTWLSVPRRDKTAASPHQLCHLAESLLTGGSVALTGALLCLMERQSLDVAWPEVAAQHFVVISSEPRQTERSVSTDAITLDGEGRKLRLYFSSDTDPRLLAPGRLLHITARIERPRQWHRGNFDYRQYLLAHGYVGTAFVSSRQVDTGGNEALLRQLSATQRLRLRFMIWRHGLLQRYGQLSMDTAETAVLRAMTLGDKTQLPQRVRQAYSDTGASHVLALSGLHLSIVAWFMLLWVRRRRFVVPAGVLTLALVWGFALVAGLPVSVVRAATMVSVYVVMRMGRRDSNGLNSLSLAALLILTASPLSLCDVGFQLSFLAVAGILGIVPSLQPWLTALQERMEPLPEPLNRMAAAALSVVWNLTAVSVAAQIGTAPLVAYHFGQLPLYFLAVNWLVIPLAYGILCIGLPSVILPPLLHLTAPLLRWLLHTMNAGIGRIAAWPGACIGGLHPSAFDVVLCYLLIVAIYLITTFFIRPPTRFSTMP